MVATASLLYRMGIEGGAGVRAEISSVGTEEEKTAARAIAAADRKAERVAAVERQLQAVKQQSVDADQRALALVTGNTAAYETAKRREVAADRESAAVAKSAVDMRSASFAEAFRAIDAAANQSGKSAAASARVFEQAFGQAEASAKASADRQRMAFVESFRAIDAAANQSGKSAAASASDFEQAFSRIEANVAGLRAFEAQQATVGRSAAESAGVFQQAYQQMEVRTHALIAAMDPTYAALMRVSSAQNVLKEAFDAGIITEDRYIALQDQLQRELQQSAAAGGRVFASVGQMRAGAQQLSYQIGDVAQQFALGTPPMIIFAQQGGQVIQAIQLMRNESGGFLGFLAGPWGAVITGAVMILATLAVKFWESGDSASKAAGGVQSYTDALKRLQDQGGTFDFGSREFAKVSEEALKAQARVARLEQELRNPPKAVDLIALGPGAVPLNGRDGTVVRAELAEARRTLTDRQSEVNALMMQRRNREVVDRPAPERDRAAESLGRQSAAMEVNAAASLELARAYLTNSDAALKAEAARKGLTDATRKGIDGEAQVRRQLDIMVGEQLVSGAKSVAQLREETEGRRAANDNVVAGRIAYAQMNRAMADEAALRPLIKLQTTAQGEALVLLTQAIEAYRAALKQAHDEEGRSAALAGTADARQRVSEIRASILDLNRNPMVQAENAARRAAEREADAGRFAGQERTDYIDARVMEARAQYSQRIAENYVRTRQDQEDQLALAQAELGLLGKSDAVRERELGLLELSLQMKRDGLTEEDAAYQATMARAAALEDVLVELTRQKQSMEELRQIGGDVIDTIFDPQAWDDWGALGKRVLQELLQDMLVLAAVNPLKNALLGSDLPTIAGLFGGWTGGVQNGSDALGLGNLTGNAVGTLDWQGGMMIAGENGAELIDAPPGSRVYPAAETRRLLEAPAKGGDTHIHQHFHNQFAGNSVTMEDAVMLAQAAKEGAIQAISDRQRRAA